MSTYANKLKPIQTVYNGYKFRSRLEARWAVFFDAMGIKYQYEHEGFDLGGLWYLPDFYLPEKDIYIEIKPDLPKFRQLEPLYKMMGSQEPGKNTIYDNIFMICGDPYHTTLKADLSGLVLKSGHVILSFGCIHFGVGLLYEVKTFKHCPAHGSKWDIWPVYVSPRLGPKSVFNLKKYPTLVSGEEYWSIAGFVPESGISHTLIPRHYFGDGVEYRSGMIDRAYIEARQARFNGT